VGKPAIRPEDALRESPNPPLCGQPHEEDEKTWDGLVSSHEDRNFNASHVKHMKKRGAVIKTRAAFDHGGNSKRA
jgi:hypothetical protein